MFKKILIANRGEIACRVMKTARRLGIKTVAVYSEADKEALHVQQADEAVAIGPAPAAESYLRIERIVQACLDSGAEAVHPGYGFLSENARFAQALADAGIVFIGPNIKAIEAMGDKITSKKIAMEAGVNTIPGFTEAIKDADQAVTIANDVGYPVMLKASAGGGGKGMRVAFDAQQCREGFERASSEARSSFGDDRVFIEKFIEQPRHIEIQILADSHGNTIYLGERECSIQRRHQKVIEEAPSPLLDEATRQAMGEQACTLAKAVDYRSAGTVEFVVDPQRNFYFLEMNTRLQVEHPVTELVTGLDLVELMLQVATGEVLPLCQEQVQLKGWAIEARIYAEDPLRNFMPSTGRLKYYSPPQENTQVRVDTGVFEGGEVSMFYDPMIAKLVAYGDDRSAAIDNSLKALDEFYIDGVNHNIGFVAALLSHPRFATGNLTTNFIAEEYPDGFAAPLPPPDKTQIFVALAAALHCCYAQRAARTDGQLPGQHHQIGQQWVVIIDQQHFTVAVQAQHEQVFIIHAEQDITVDLRTWRFGQALVPATVAGQTLYVQLQRNTNTIKYRLFHAGYAVEALVLTPRAATLQDLMLDKPAPDMSKYLLSPMPGLLREVLVEQGADVSAGQPLAIVEAMKMENVLTAAQDGKVATIAAQPGDSLAVDQAIIEFE